MRKEAVRPLALLLLTLSLMCAPLPAAKKTETPNSQDPYKTAEYETLPGVNADDLAYRAIVFEDFVIPAEWEDKARKLVNESEDQAITRLTSRHGFTLVGKKQNPLPQEPHLDVKCTLVEYRMVGTALRVFAGAAGGTSYITYKVEVSDGSGAPLFQRRISTENNAFAAAWSFNDKRLPAFLGNVLADYLALRARKDKGVNVVTLEADAATLKSK
jgi:hypothetical protein